MNNNRFVFTVIGIVVAAVLLMLSTNAQNNVPRADISVVPTSTFTPTPRPNLPPDCSQAVSQPDAVWPPDHEFVSIATAGVMDPDGEPVVLTVTGIWQDEPVGVIGPDGKGVGTAAAEVRAERDGTGDGRVYHIFFEARDDFGGTCSGEVTVGVSKSPDGEATPVDGGALYDSTLGS